MHGTGAHCSSHTIGLIDNRSTIAEQNDIRRVVISRQPKRMEQRQPFGIHAAAIADIAFDMHDPADDDGKFHLPRIGAASAIEEYFQAAMRIGCHRATGLRLA